MLIPLLFVLVILYALGMGYLYYHWRRIRPAEPRDEELPKTLLASVVVVVRNEEANIKALLTDLALQKIDPEVFEVLVVDDHSTDRTCSIVEEMVAGLAYPLQLLHNTENGKKAGLELGISRASAGIIAVTDGDCRLPENWLKTIISPFLDRKAVFVSGPVTFNGEKNFFEQLQTIEFASLVGAGAALLQAGKPGMCNAANMAFLKSVYEEAGGLSTHRHIPSGDDEFLLQSIFLLYPTQVLYLKSRKAVVSTQAQESWKMFYHQRKRWAGKWQLHKNPWVAFTALAVFFLQSGWIFLFAALLLVGSVGWQTLFYFFIASIIKFGAEFLFLRIVLRSLGKKLLLLPFLALQLIYPFYVLFFGLAVNFGGFSWKGRTYKYTKT